MKTFNNYLIVTSMTELCRLLRKDNIKVVKITPIKGIANEDCIRFEYRCVKERS